MYADFRAVSSWTKWLVGRCPHSSQLNYLKFIPDANERITYRLNTKHTTNYIIMYSTQP